MKINVSDKQLAALAQMGDKRASELLLNKYKPLVRRICDTYFMAGATADDVLQEGMIGLYHGIMHFDQEKNPSFASFAALCIKRRVISALDAANRKKHQPLNTSVSLDSPVSQNDETCTLGDTITDDSLDPEKLMISLERRECVGKRLGQILSPFEKRVLIEYLRERSYREIALKLKVSVKAVDGALHRIRVKLSKIQI